MTTQPAPAPRTVAYEATDEDVANMRKVLPSVVKRIEAEAAAGQSSGALLVVRADDALLDALGGGARLWDAFSIAERLLAKGYVIRKVEP